MRSFGDIEKKRLRSVDDKPRVCVRDVHHLLWYTKRWFHKMITRRYYKLFMLNKFAASSTLNNCLAKINIYGSFFLNRHCISARNKYLVRNFDFAGLCVLVKKPIQYELFPVPHTLLFRLEKGRKKGKTISKIY